MRSFIARHFLTRDAMTLNQWYLHRLKGHAAAMAVITLIARLLGVSNGVMSAHGFVLDLLFNVVVGTMILHLIDRAKAIA